jgi:hypothetical protein
MQLAKSQDLVMERLRRKKPLASASSETPASSIAAGVPPGVVSTPVDLEAGAAAPRSSSTPVQDIAASAKLPSPRRAPGPSSPTSPTHSAAQFGGRPPVAGSVMDRGSVFTGSASSTLGPRDVDALLRGQMPEERQFLRAGQGGGGGRRGSIGRALSPLVERAGSAAAAADGTDAVNSTGIAVGAPVGPSAGAESIAPSVPARDAEAGAAAHAADFLSPGTRGRERRRSLAEKLWGEVQPRTDSRRRSITAGEGAEAAAAVAASGADATAASPLGVTTAGALIATRSKSPTKAGEQQRARC